MVGVVFSVCGLGGAHLDGYCTLTLLVFLQGSNWQFSSIKFEQGSKRKKDGKPLSSNDRMSIYSIIHKRYRKVH